MGLFHTVKNFVLLKKNSLIFVVVCHQFLVEWSYFQMICGIEKAFLCTLDVPCIWRKSIAAHFVLICQTSKIQMQ